MAITDRTTENVILYNEAGSPLSISNPLVISSVDGMKATYSAAIASLNVSSSATDIFTITGSTSKLIKITRIALMGTQSTGSSRDIYLIKRSTANSGGNSSILTAVPFDSTSSAATATVRAYTSNPSSLGTIVGNVRTRKVFISVASGNNSNADEMILEFGTRNSQALMLRGTSEVIAINLNGITINGNSFNISIEWTEE